jgi:hypothetical protein
VVLRLVKLLMIAVYFNFFFHIDMKSILSNTNTCEGSYLYNTKYFNRRKYSNINVSLCWQGKYK